MGNEIKLHVAELRTRANDIVEYSKEQEQIIQKITNLMLNLDSEWKGDAQAAYLAKFMSMKSTFAQLTEALNNYAILINSTCEKMETKDREMMNRIKAV